MLEVVWQVEYVFVGTGKMGEIYGAVVGVCEREGLWGVARGEMMEGGGEGNMPWEEVEKVFPSRDL